MALSLLQGARYRWLTAWFGGFLLCFSLAGHAMDWPQYRSQFIRDGGRVVDTANGNISHSEGQGYGMLLAVANDDRNSFDLLWQWTRQHLGRHDVALFAWRYDPNAKPHITDNNNAADGDLLIAWALLKAGLHWQDSNYLRLSKRIRDTIRDKMVRVWAGQQVLLPGLAGFTGNDFVDINLSYWVMPALKDFADADGPGSWQPLLASGQALLAASQFGSHKLPTDWVRLYQNGRVTPAPKWSPRFGYDAVRIPLYYCWADLCQAPALASIKAYWQHRQPLPAWVNVNTGTVAAYPASAGVEAIRSLLLTGNLPAAKPVTSYYASSLLLLSRLAVRQQ
ncbi:glycosyl hydrolase family 8 [Gallaecimonas sp. GXIMD1310]|uniref:glycosyl hydrolase family 8 n=1 Tax=Gallaecimonas sp. GXIMD1310 TaxID=3131926 RepID=UPI00324BC9E7